MGTFIQYLYSVVYEQGHENKIIFFFETVFTPKIWSNLQKLKINN